MKLQDGVLFADTTLQAPSTATREDRLLALADRLIDRLEDEIDGAFASASRCGTSWTARTHSTSGLDLGSTVC